MKHFLIGFIFGGLVVAGALQGRGLWHRVMLSDEEHIRNMIHDGIDHLPGARFMEVETLASQEPSGSSVPSKDSKGFDVTVIYERNGEIKSMKIPVFYYSGIWWPPSAARLEIADSQANVLLRKKIDGIEIHGNARLLTDLDFKSIVSEAYSQAEKDAKILYISVKDENTVTVNVGVNEGYLSGGGESFELKKEAGKWHRHGTSVFWAN